MTNEESKQAEEILCKHTGWTYSRSGEYNISDVVDAMGEFAESYASLRVAEATKEMYPKEFVEWLKENCDTINIGETIDPQWLWEVRDRLITADTKKVFEYWKQNIRK